MYEAVPIRTPYHVTREPVLLVGPRGKCETFGDVTPCLMTYVISMYRLNVSFFC